MDNMTIISTDFFFIKKNTWNVHLHSFMWHPESQRESKYVLLLWISLQSANFNVFIIQNMNMGQIGFYNVSLMGIWLQFETFRCTTKNWDNYFPIEIVDFGFWCSMQSKMIAKFLLSLCFIAWISVCSGDDVVVQMFSKNPINFISDKYVSYSVDPVELLAMNEENQWVKCSFRPILKM